MSFNPMFGVYPSNQESYYFNNMDNNNQAQTSERITSTTTSTNKPSAGSTAGYMTEEQQKAWDDAMQNERFTLYQQAYPDIKSEKDYYKYVYDTDNLNLN